MRGLPSGLWAVIDCWEGRVIFFSGEAIDKVARAPVNMPHDVHANNQNMCNFSSVDRSLL